MALTNEYLDQLKQTVKTNLERLTTEAPLTINGNLTLDNGYISADEYIIDGVKLQEIVKVDEGVTAESLKDIIKLGQLPTP